MISLRGHVETAHSLFSKSVDRTIRSNGPLLTDQFYSSAAEFHTHFACVQSALSLLTTKKMYPKEVALPSDEELQTEELTMSSIALKAGGVFCGKFCDFEFKEFMLCRQETRDPRKCLKEGKEATKCGLQFYRLVKEGCYDQFERYWRCIDVAGPYQQLVRCRKTQSKFDQCVKDKIGLERPPLGFFSSVRIHDSTRPRPRKVPIRDYHKLESLPDQFQGVDPNKGMPSNSGWATVNRAN